MNDTSASKQIDDIIKQHGGWKGNLIKQLRAIIKDADTNIIEEIKWKMATRPEGLAVWSNNGIVCFAEIWKDNIKLIFPKGSQLLDRNKLFNSRLKSSTIRAIEFHEGDMINEVDAKALIVESVKLNANKVNRTTN